MTEATPQTARPSAVTTVPATTTGWSVGALGAVQSCLSESGSSWASRGLGAGPTAGRLIVARASLVHQINAAAIMTTTAIAAAANTSALVRRSGLTIRGQATPVQLAFAVTPADLRGRRRRRRPL